jgi:hypothetical protein
LPRPVCATCVCLWGFCWIRWTCCCRRWRQTMSCVGQAVTCHIHQHLKMSE